MLDIRIVENFKNIGHRWKTDRGLIEPSEDDVRKVLDHAAARLYDGKVGDRLTVGGLIIEKTSVGYDVYAYMGQYY